MRPRLVIALFFWLLALLYAHGDEQFIVDRRWLAGIITAGQFVILGPLTYLARTPRRLPAA